MLLSDLQTTLNLMTCLKTIILVYPEAEDVRDLDILRDFDMRCEYGPCLGWYLLTIKLMYQLVIFYVYYLVYNHRYRHSDILEVIIIITMRIS